MNQHLQSAARIIHAGGVVAYPTETVYGLGCDPFNEQAVRRLLKIKRRPVEKGLILVAADLRQLEGLVRLSEAERTELAARWPGPVTYLLPALPSVPAWITGRHDQVAVRVSGHGIARALASAVGTPIVSTSANRAGEPPARNAFNVARRLGGELDFVVNGDTGGGKPSTIIDLDSGRVVRD
ncbi:threonylcarbamoyl-AMP synthase [Alcanivorax sp. N3-2A]|nr:threonylcarbamoyl-AMP synthase [Alcanivorax sp. N3-2A]|tara:strand:+ start:68864 stop:69409 length:546 start_codon:yes stop_codon:yes gene_type:complete